MRAHFEGVLVEQRVGPTVRQLFLRFPEAQVVMGMPHRGRLNVLCTLLGKQPGALFAEMDHQQSTWHVGDVPFHLGQSARLAFAQPVRPAAGRLLRAGHQPCALLSGHTLGIAEVGAM